MQLVHKIEAPPASGGGASETYDIVIYTRDELELWKETFLQHLKSEEKNLTYAVNRADLAVAALQARVDDNFYECQDPYY